MGQDLARTASAVESLNSTATIDYKAELVRKSIHLVSLSIPTVYYFITKELALSIWCRSRLHSWWST